MDRRALAASRRNTENRSNEQTESRGGYRSSHIDFACLTANADVHTEGQTLRIKRLLLRLSNATSSLDVTVFLSAGKPLVIKVPSGCHYRFYYLVDLQGPTSLRDHFVNVGVSGKQKAPKQIE